MLEHEEDRRTQRERETDATERITTAALVCDINPFNARCSKLLLFEGFSAILV